MKRLRVLATLPLWLLLSAPTPAPPSPLPLATTPPAITPPATRPPAAPSPLPSPIAFAIAFAIANCLPIPFALSFALALPLTKSEPQRVPDPRRDRRPARHPDHRQRVTLPPQYQRLALLGPDEQGLGRGGHGRQRQLFVEGQAVSRRSSRSPQALCHQPDAEPLRGLHPASSGSLAFAGNITFAGTITFQQSAGGATPDSDQCPIEPVGRHPQAALRDPSDHRRGGPGDRAHVLAPQHPHAPPRAGLEIGHSRTPCFAA